MSLLRKYNAILYVLTIILCLVVLVDTYLPFTHTLHEKCIKKEIVLKRSRINFWAARLITTSKNKIFTLPEEVYDAITEDDSIGIRCSSFLGVTKGIIYNDKDAVYFIRLAPIYGRLPGLILNLAPLLTSAVLLFYTLKVKKNIELRHAIALFVIALVIVYTYMVSQS